MKTTIGKFALGTLSLCTAATLFAAPLRRADVPANPAWLAHVDCDGLRTTAVGQFIQSEMSKPQAQNKLAAFQALFSFDLRTQLHGLTLYGTGPAPHDGVLLVYADFDPDRLITLAKAAKEAANTQHKQHVIYSWLDERRHARQGVRARVYAAISGRCVVFGQREERVAQALDILDGAAPSLASSQNFAQLGGAGDTSFIEGAMRKVELPEGAPHAEMLKLSRQGRLQLAETQGQVILTVSLEADTEEIAGNISSIANGLIALMKLQQEKPEAVKLANALMLKQNGPSVTVTASLSGADVVAIMKADAARKAAKRAEKE